MRFVFLIPDLITGALQRQTFSALCNAPIRRHVFQRIATNGNLRVITVRGGTLNLMRHCQVACSQGADAVLATASGRDRYGRQGKIDILPFIRWSDRRPDDICVLTDIYSKFADAVAGPVIVYLQNPRQIRNDFDYRSDRVTLWTDSPFMLERCQEAYPGKDIEIVPNVVDCDTFPFIPQAEREPGVLFAFPRKGLEFIRETMDHYHTMGGSYWRVCEVDGLSIGKLGKAFGRPQAFLASADVEGCALPPQESMASGVVVVGKDARGANFSMQHRETAMVAQDPEAAAVSLREIEDDGLREKISRNAYAFIQRFFRDNEPAALWSRAISRYAESP